MWVKIRETKNLMMAETWKEFFEAEGIPTRVLTTDNKPVGTEFAAYTVYIPEDKKHVVEEILRKL